MNALLRFSIAAILAFAAATAFAETSCNEPNETCNAKTQWQDLNAIALKVSYPAKAGYVKWRSTYDGKSNDFRLDSEISDGKAAKAGTMLVVGGLVMAAKGDLVKPGLEFQLLDGAALSQQLVYRLLATALPDGPENFGKAAKIDYASEEIGMVVKTQSSEAIIAAPWRVTGRVQRLADGAVEYDLKLTSGDDGETADGGNTYNPSLSGRVWKLAAARLDDSISLEGWKTYNVGVEIEASDGPAMAAVSPADSYRTVAEVRRQLAANHAGEPDATKDFSGIWKEQCEDEFGLRIVRNDEDGKYIIGFCGPGFCEDTDHARHSFITGDSNYEIISDNELIQTGEQGGRQRYRRCAAGEN